VDLNTVERTSIAQQTRDSGLHSRSRETRLRREARRHGLRLLKSRARDPNDETFGGYMLVYIERNAVAYIAAGHRGKAYRLNLDGVEAYLRRRKRGMERTG